MVREPSVSLESRCDRFWSDFHVRLLLRSNRDKAGVWRIQEQQGINN